ncbi:unnamed protein product [Allacma fusca]|uniref:Glucose-methanol-choline oxidoreductase N-terminal domain-containing protein n=1 Tax=Allacma fusca TaxID=39272 RepID=A0A8J2JNC8_9HEXA|nr:unnamed protein product [Allacma fusca]
MEDKFDFIIVGAGTAGSVVANRLSENFKVLLLEAGGEPNPLQSIPYLSPALLGLPHTDWEYLANPQVNACLAMNERRCSWPRGKSLGGTSNLNYLIYMRGHKNDYESWANISGDPRWRYENVLKYFKKSEDYDGESDHYHSHGGNIRVGKSPYTGMADIFCKAAEEFGIPRADLNAEFIKGCSPLVITAKNGRRVGSYGAFLRHARHRRNLHIRKFARVTRLLFEGPENRAIGVEYNRHGLSKFVYASKEVILSAGALNSPQLLMLSGIGPREHLESFGIPVLADLPVGSNLQDHVSTLVGPFIINQPITFNPETDLKPEELIKFITLGEGVLASTYGQASAYLVSEVAKSRNQSDWPDIQYFMYGTNMCDACTDRVAHSLNVRVDVLRTFYRDILGKNSFQIQTVVSRPYSRGQVRLRGRNPLLPPSMDANYFTHVDDIKVAVEGAKRAVDLVEKSSTFRALNATLYDVSFPGCEHYKFRSEGYWECFHRQLSLTVFHVSGTCPMGKPTSPNAVVDSELRVLETKNLRIIDASIMPHITTGNTNAPIVMIGEIGSEMILKSIQDSTVLEYTVKCLKCGL